MGFLSDYQRDIFAIMGLVLAVLEIASASRHPITQSGRATYFPTANRLFTAWHEQLQIPRKHALVVLWLMPVLFVVVALCHFVIPTNGTISVGEENWDNVLLPLAISFIQVGLVVGTSILVAVLRLETKMKLVRAKLFGVGVSGLVAVFGYLGMHAVATYPSTWDMRLIYVYSACIMGVGLVTGGTIATTD